MEECNKWENAILKALKKAKFDNLKKSAYDGNMIAQMVLGDMFFYGINPSFSYIGNIERVMASAKYRESVKTGYPHSKFKDFAEKNLAVLCECSEEPDYREALNWYTMAAFSGSNEAIEKVRMINENEMPEIHGGIKKHYMLQFFRLEDDERG